MDIQIAIEPLNGKGYRASCRSPLALTVEATTRAEAIRQMQETLEARLKNGTEIVTVKVPATEENPWLRLAGSLDPNDPMVQEWLHIMAENRRTADEEPDAW